MISKKIKNEFKKIPFFWKHFKNLPFFPLIISKNYLVWDDKWSSIH